MEDKLARDETVHERVRVSLDDHSDQLGAHQDLKVVPDRQHARSAFTNGLWTHAPVSVPTGGSVRITVSRSAGTSAVLSGLFLGGGA
jgi:hypothetical protein